MLAVEHEQVAQADDALAIQIQFTNCRTANRSQPDKNEVVAAPGKMLRPVIPARVKERHLASGGEIKRVRLAGFGPITTLTSQGKIVCGAWPTLAFRHDVFDGMKLRRTKFRAEAVFAIAQRALPDQAPQFSWHARLSHAAPV